MFAGEYTVSVTDKKQTIDGIEYVELTGDNGTSAYGASFYGIKGNNYYLRSAGTSPTTNAPFDLTQLYLNDKEAAGYSWDFTGGHGNGFTAKMPGKILEKGISVTIQGKTYNNVIHTKLNLSYDLPVVGNMSYMFYDYYVAKGIGIVKIVAEGDPAFGLGGISSVIELLEYNIK